MIVAWRDARDEERAGDDGQRGRRPWSVSLAKLVNFCGDGGPVAGVLQLGTIVKWPILGESLPATLDGENATPLSAARQARSSLEGKER